MSIFTKLNAKFGASWKQFVAAALLLGTLLMIIGRGFFSRDTDNGNIGNNEPSGIPYFGATEESRDNIQSSSVMAADLARELENILGRIEGAGEVFVMLHMSSGSEMIFAQNHTTDESFTTETDANNGTRNIETYSHQNNHVALRQNDGSEVPLIIMEIAPRIEGVIIVAQGGGNAAVRESLVRAAHTVLGIRPHQVQVFQMN